MRRAAGTAAPWALPVLRSDLPARGEVPMPFLGSMRADDLVNNFYA